MTSAIEASATNGSEHTAEYRVVHPGGQVRWLVSRAAPARDEHGRITRLIGALADITERRQAEEALRTAQNRLATALGIARLGIWDCDTENRIVHFDERCREILGLPENRACPVEEMVALVHPDDRERVSKEVAHALTTSGNLVCDTEFRIARPDNSPGSVAMRGERHLSADARLRFVGTLMDITERKQTEGHLRQSQRTFAELVERAPFGVYVVDSRFRIAQMNTGSQTGAFRNVRPVIGRDFAEAMRILWPEPVATELIATFRHTLETGEPYFSRGFVQPRQDVAETEAYEWELHRLMLPDGQPGVICYYFDSTRLRQAEKAQRESEERLQEALRVSRSFAFEWDPASDVVHRSQSCAALLGLEGESITCGSSQSYFERVHPEDRERFQDQLRQLAPGADRYQSQYRIVRPDGGITVLEESGRGFFDGSGKLCRLVGITTDVTERVRAEERLRASESFHRQTLESIPGMVFTTRPDGYCDYQSRQWMEYTGVPLAEHLGDGWNQLLHPDDRPRAFEAWRAAVEGRAPYDIDYRVRRHDGVFEWFKVIGRPIRDHSGQIARWFGLALNIQDLKDAEHALEASLAHKEVLLQEIHHRVKNNMQVLSSLVSLQAETLTDDATRAAFSDVCNRVRSMALVHEKLYQSGDLASLDFPAYAQSLLEYLWRAHRQPAAIDLKLDFTEIAIGLDKAVPCGLILNELAANALKHAFRGRPSGAVTVAGRTLPDGRLSLTVSDDGVGLPGGWDWRQAPSLGLRLVQLLSRQVGGTVEARSREGGGTEFQLVFTGGAPGSSAEGIGEKARNS